MASHRGLHRLSTPYLIIITSQQHLCFHPFNLSQSFLLDLMTFRSWFYSSVIKTEVDLFNGCTHTDMTLIYYCHFYFQTLMELSLGLTSTTAH